jgi:hypothetical protein
MKRTLSYANGWAAEMVYCIAAGDVAAHVAANYLSPYPGASYLHVAQITDEPWMDGDVVQASGLSMARKLTYSFALDYLDVPWPSNITRPSYLAGTTLRLETKFSGKYLPLPARAIDCKEHVTPASNPDGSAYTGPPVKPAMQGNQNINILIPLTDFVIEWDRIQDLGVMDWDGQIGFVNQAEFLGCEPETLLFEGVSLTPSFVLNPSNPHAWKATAALKQQRIVVGDAIYGWNHIYYPLDGWKHTGLTQTGTLYPLADFSDMFNTPAGP